MRRAACLTSIFLLVASLPAAAAANQEIIREAVRAAAGADNSGQQPQQPRPPQPRQSNNNNSNNDSPTRHIAEQVVANGKRSRHGDDDRNGRYHNPLPCTVYTGCQFGSLGAPTFDELRHFYRNYPESELWNICMGRRSPPFAYGSQGACMMIGSPNPQRPVDLPRYLEHGDALSAEETELQAAIEGEIVDVAVEETELPPCTENETLNRKRPRRNCVETPKPVE
ncbi:MAG TPA: hypothetical protein VGO61_12665 [Steroidobacteraceae bacterium]|jgi:hypothetical protein|nr:hypothetical protein [Steroidobacteraceae bacterium]